MQAHSTDLKTKGTAIKMTIYRQEGNPSGKRNARYAKFPSLSRKRNSLKSLPPIYEAEEDYEEGLLDRESEVRNLQVNTSVPRGEKRGVNKMRQQQQRCGEFPSRDRGRSETNGYLKRNLGNNSSVSHVERKNQMVFPDFFPPGMHVHCARNALPEASKGLYMKIMQGESELEHARNICKTNKTMNVSNNSSYKQQNWMQFFG